MLCKTEVSTIKILLYSQIISKHVAIGSSSYPVCFESCLTVMFRVPFACHHLQYACVPELGCSKSSVKIPHYRAVPEELCGAIVV